MQDTVEIAGRFCGPPDSGNGGYVAGLLAVRTDDRGPVKVRLRRPPPLDTALEIVRTSAGASELVHAGGTLAIAEPGALGSMPEESPTFEVARNLSRSYPGFHRHPFPGCFVCGPDRAHGDGLRIFPGPWQSGQVAAPWTPDATLDRGDGLARPEHVWAALDCPGYFAIGSDGRRMLLGEITAQLERGIRIGEPCVVVGWHIASAGRKHQVGTAIYGEDGNLCGRAEALWIEPRPAMQSPALADSSSQVDTAHAA